MATATLHETWLTYKYRRNELNTQISYLQGQKNLAVYSRADKQSLRAAEEQEVRNQWREYYENNCDCCKDNYKDYTEIPDFDEAMDKIAAKYNDEIAQLEAWESQIDVQITTDSAELEEVKAYMESIKSMLSSNIQDDYEYGLK